MHADTTTLKVMVGSRVQGLWSSGVYGLADYSCGYCASTLKPRRLYSVRWVGVVLAGRLLQQFSHEHEQEDDGWMLLLCSVCVVVSSTNHAFFRTIRNFALGRLVLLPSDFAIVT